MNRDVWLTDRAHADMEAAYLWWAENRSQSQAAKWYSAFAEQSNRWPLTRRVVLSHTRTSSSLIKFMTSILESVDAARTELFSQFAET